MKFRYSAFDRAGAPKSAVIEASSPADASEMLRREGLFVAELKPVGEAVAAAAGRATTRGTRRVRLVASFSRQMAVLVTNGTRVADALVAMERQARDPGWHETIADIRRRVEEGSTFSDSIASHPDSFDAVAVSLVRAGESSGRLDIMLQRLADISLQRLRIRQTVIGAMVYPCVLLGISVAVVLAMLFFVLPRFSGLFESMQVPLPPTTRLLMSLSALLTGYWFVLAPLAMGLAAMLVLWIRSGAGRRSLDALIIRAPIVGGVARSFATARVARMLGLLMDARVSLLESLELAREASSNHAYRALLSSTTELVQKGEALSQCLSKGELIDAAVIEALRSAERSGTIGPVLISMADYLDEENRAAIKSITSLLEPAILIVLGLVVGFIATSMFLPLFDLTSAGGGPR